MTTLKQAYCHSLLMGFFSNLRYTLAQTTLMLKMRSRAPCPQLHSKPYELESKLLKGGYMGDYIGGTIRVIKGDTRSLDYSSYELLSILACLRRA